MKILTENIDNIDAFYKTKSEEDFAIDLPNGFWAEIEAHLPNAPLVPNGLGASANKGINWYYAAAFYAAGLLSAVLVYTIYLRFSHQSDVASIKVENPVLETELVTKPEEAPSEPKKEIMPTNLPNQTKASSVHVHASTEARREEESSRNASIRKTPVTESEQSFVDQKKDLGKNTPAENELPQNEAKISVDEEKSSVPTVKKEQTDFFQKHSQKVSDSLSKKLFIEKK